MSAPRKGLSRRRFLAASGAAAAGATAINVLPNPAFAAGHGGGGSTIPRDRLGIQLFTIRDVISRAPNPGTGVGGGFRFAFEQLAAMGYDEVEFAGYTQSTSILGRQITPEEIRRLLEDNGLRGNGSHINFSDDTIEAQLDIAETLGLPYLGTASIPTDSRFKSDWERAADDFNRWGELARARGIRLYQHNHHAEYDFLLDAGPKDANGNPTASSGLRALDYFFTLVDPKLVWFEMDIFWGFVAQHRYRSFTDAKGRQRTSIYDPLETVLDRPHRFPLFHVKDGVRADNDDGFEMTTTGDGDMPLREFLNRIKLNKGFHHPNIEQDNAPGAAPGQSLEFSRTSADNASDWRRRR
ncbi:MAG: sugar phosphate isomerase/epimerase family protein [Actinomadura sp.]